MQTALKSLLLRQHYTLIGKHSGLKICDWTKKALRGQDVCYKAKFYGIASHRCVQMSPALNRCAANCLHCWRELDFNAGMALDETDEPETIIEGCLAAQAAKLSGFWGAPQIEGRLLAEAKRPAHFAISLTGEPTIYPRLPELVDELRARGLTSFVVSNGLFPERLAALTPTQLYLSAIAPDRALFEKLARPRIGGAWSRICESVAILAELGRKTRTVLRLTLMRGLNDKPESYVEMVETARPRFIEVKAYMAVGAARLGYEHTPSHTEVRAFARVLAEKSGYRLANEKVNSRVVLLIKPGLRNALLEQA